MKSATKTYQVKAAEAKRDWKLIDASGKTLGRLATEIALVLRGKRKATYTPHVDCGDFVVVVNAAKIGLTGRKLTDKKYFRHSPYPGGVRLTAAGEMLEKHPDRMLKLAVAGMLPKTTLGRKLLTKLKVYAGPDHPHGAQMPAPPVVAAH